MGDVAVRLATEGDVSAILAIYNERIVNSVATFDSEPQTLEEKLAWFRESQHPYAVLVAEREREVVGWASLYQLRSRAAYRYTAGNSVYVRMDCLGQGIGAALMLRLIAVAAENGFHTMIAGISLPNPASVRLHERMGFEMIGVEREVGYKFERWIDVGWWQLMV